MTSAFYERNLKLSFLDKLIQTADETSVVGSNLKVGANFPAPKIIKIG